MTKIDDLKTKTGNGFCYDLDLLEQELDSQGSRLIYKKQATSTIDIAAECGLNRSVIVADHQTKGRGRYGRSWVDLAGESLLVTFIRPITTCALENISSLELSHLFALAVWKSLHLKEVKVRWPNDIFKNDNKIGGVLLSEGLCNDNCKNIMFSTGINCGSVDETVGKAASLTRLNRTDLLLEINRNLDMFLGDLSRLKLEQIHSYYSKLWNEASYLTGRKIRVRGLEGGDVCGTVVDSPFGEALQIEDGLGSIIELEEYGHRAHIETL